MGQAISGGWQNQDALDCVSFITGLLGSPYIYSSKAQGMAVWLKRNLIGKKLLGQPVCFEKIVVKDSKEDYLWVFVRISFSIDQQQSLTVFNNVGYDSSSKTLWVKCNSLEDSLVYLKYITDIAVGDASAWDVAGSGVIPSTLDKVRLDNTPGGKLNMCLLKRLYKSLCSNVNVVSNYVKDVSGLPDNKFQCRCKNGCNGHMEDYEKFIDEPWYVVNGAYISNQPLEVALYDNEDQEYYHTIDEYMAKKNVSKCPDAYPRAPSGKPTWENFHGLNQHNKKKEMLANKMSPSCKGACVARYNKQKGKENLINFNAYKNYKKPAEHLINFNAYKNYKKKPVSFNEHLINLGEMTGLIKKKNT